MSDYEEMGGNQTQAVSSEVQSLFAESQAILSDNNKPYDCYVPLSVQIEDESWDNLLPEVVDGQEEKERFNNEVEMLRSVHSDHIIQYYDSWYDTQRNRIIIITQYITSGTIAE